MQRNDLMHHDEGHSGAGEEDDKKYDIHPPVAGTRHTSGSADDASNSRLDETGNFFRRRVHLGRLSSSSPCESLCHGGW